jgi:hypothetical protein
VHRGAVPEAGRDEIAAERRRVVADDAVGGAGDREPRTRHEAGGVSAHEYAMARNGLRESDANAAPAPRKDEPGLVRHDREGQCDREHEQLRASEERKRQSGHRGGVAGDTRAGNRPMAEKDRPNERWVRRVLRQQGRGEDEPRRERRERGGHEARRPGRTGRAREQVRRPRRAREQERVECVGRRLRLGRAQRPVERRNQERVELAERAVVDAVDHRHGREPLGDADREPRDLELVRHHRPRGGPNGVVPGECGGPEHATNDDERRRPQAEPDRATAGHPCLERQRAFETGCDGACDRGSPARA